ncbi:MAG TPA: aldo/keto reductase [Myxococcales bacterium]|nr:aldo/keto reductase [Myxococcales bacterium]
MELRPFGPTGLRVSEIGLGCARLGGVFQGEAAGFLDVLSAALDAGINFFDTADMYSQGESEILLGRALRGRRDGVVIATKAGYRLPAQRRLAGRLKPLLRPLARALGLRRENLPAAVRGEPSQDFSPEYLKRSLEGSLRRLQTDRIELFQLHSPPAEIVARGEWVQALEALKREGKILHYGVSCDAADAALAALSLPGVSSLQLRINLLDQRMVGLLPAARARGVGVIARECLANGLLVKDEVDLSRYCASPEEAEERAAQLVTYRKQAAESGFTLAQVAMRYVTALEGVSVALVGARTPAQLQGLLRELASEPPLSFGDTIRQVT